MGDLGERNPAGEIDGAFQYRPRLIQSQEAPEPDAGLFVRCHSSRRASPRLESAHFATVATDRLIHPLPLAASVIQYETRTLLFDSSNKPRRAGCNDVKPDRRCCLSKAMVVGKDCLHIEPDRSLEVESVEGAQIRHRQ